MGKFDDKKLKTASALAMLFRAADVADDDLVSDASTMTFTVDEVLALAEHVRSQEAEIDENDSPSSSASSRIPKGMRPSNC